MDSCLLQVFLVLLYYIMIISSVYKLHVTCGILLSCGALVYLISMIEYRILPSSWGRSRVLSVMDSCLLQVFLVLLYYIMIISSVYKLRGMIFLRLTLTLVGFVFAFCRMM